MSGFLPAFYVGICLSMTLIVAALLSLAAMVRESQCLTATVRIPSVGRLGAGGVQAITPSTCCMHAGVGHPLTPLCAARDIFYNVQPGLTPWGSSS